jgi:hypothetical protein
MVIKPTLCYYFVGDLFTSEGDAEGRVNSHHANTCIGAYLISLHMNTLVTCSVQCKKLYEYSHTFADEELKSHWSAHVFCLTEYGATGAAIAQAATLKGIERIDPYCAFRLRLHSQTYCLCTRRNRSLETLLHRFGFAEKSHQDPPISGLDVSLSEPGRWLRIFPSRSNLPHKTGCRLISLRSRNS